jgi:hypothetical protein
LNKRENDGNGITDRALDIIAVEKDLHEFNLIVGHSDFSPKICYLPCMHFNLWQGKKQHPAMGISREFKSTLGHRMK